MSHISPGLSFERELVVDAGRCISFMGPQAMVYATPWMVSDAEYACHDALLPHLAKGQSTAGVQVSIDHLAPTPLGMKVRVQVKVMEVLQRRVRFAFTVHDELELVGQGEHTRFIVDVDRTIARLDAKRLRAADTI